MANIFQKIFLSKNECQLIDMMKHSKITKKYEESLEHMFAIVSYCIDQNNTHVTAKYHWCHAQGDNYSLTVARDGASAVLDTVNNQKTARKIFIRMQNTYLKQRQN